MDAELKVKWVAALRNGEYLQGGKLKSADGRFCCLGVLCEVMEKLLSGFPYAFLRELLSSETVNTLMYMNDKQKKSFPEIATYIEETIA